MSLFESDYEFLSHLFSLLFNIGLKVCLNCIMTVKETFNDSQISIDLPAYHSLPCRLFATTWPALDNDLQEKVCGKQRRCIYLPHFLSPCLKNIRHTLKRQHKQYDGNLYYLGRTSLDFWWNTGNWGVTQHAADLE